VGEIKKWWAFIDYNCRIKNYYFVKMTTIRIFNYPCKAHKIKRPVLTDRSLYINLQSKN